MTQTQKIRIEENAYPDAKKHAKGLWGDLCVDTIHAQPVVVNWEAALANREGDGLAAQIVSPDFSKLDIPELLEWIEERDPTKAEDLREDAGVGLYTVDDIGNWYTREDIIDALEGRGTACFNDESTSLLTEALAEDRLGQIHDYLEEDTLADIALEMAQDDDEEFRPQMNYAYPIPNMLHSAEEAQAIVCDLPLNLTVVLLDDEPHLALTGGGMDFSPQICEGYLALGMRPPTHFADLQGPIEDTPKNRALMIMCGESLIVAQQQLGRKRLRLIELFEETTGVKP